MNECLKKCALSGHRDLNSYKLDYALLDRVIADLVKCGIKEFYCGMAVGFDLAAAESILALKEKVRLVACIPCRNQEARFSKADRKRYDRILKNCSEVRILSEEYSNGCMLSRDRYMIDNSDMLLCFLRKDSGGTYYTYNYAKSKGIKIISL